MTHTACTSTAARCGREAKYKMYKLLKTLEKDRLYQSAPVQKDWRSSGTRLR